MENINKKRLNSYGLSTKKKILKLIDQDMEYAKYLENKEYQFHVFQDGFQIEIIQEILYIQTKLKNFLVEEENL